MSDKAETLMMVITDAVSFNILCEGQLEFIKNSWSGRIVLVCGGSPAQLRRLIDRDVGEVVFAPYLKRKPSPLADLASAFHLLAVTLRFSPTVVVYSTPKALLLTSVVAFLTGVRARVALVRGRAYENYTGMRRAAFAALDRISLGLSTNVVFISESLRSAYLREGIATPGKADVLGVGSSNGINISHFRPPTSAERETSRRSLHLKADDFAVISIGRLCADKGADEFCEAVARLEPPFKFFWVGAVEDRTLLSKIHALEQKRGNVRHISEVEDVRPLLWAADAHLFLSHREGFGNVAIEAAACGLPTVAFDVVGVRDSVSAGVSGIRVPFADVSAVASALADIHASGAGKKSVLSSARDWVVSEFDQTLFWNRWLDYIAQAVRPAA